MLGHRCRRIAEYAGINVMVNLGEVMISDEILRKAHELYEDNWHLSPPIRMKAALEAVFDHIGGGDKMIEPTCNHERDRDPNIYVNCSVCGYRINPGEEEKKEVGYDTEKYLKNAKEAWKKSKRNQDVCDCPNLEEKKLINLCKIDNLPHLGQFDKRYCSVCNKEITFQGQECEEKKEPKKRCACKGDYCGCAERKTKESKKQTLLDFIGNKQTTLNERIFTDRDDYTRWLVGEISDWAEIRLKDLEQR